MPGGNFWDGARNGLISAGLNHAAHMGIQALSIRSMFRKAHIKSNGKPEYSKKYVFSLIKKIGYLKEWWKKGGSPDIEVYDAWDDDQGLYQNKLVSLNFKYLDTNYRLVSTMFHEFYHAYQDVSGITSWTVENYGKITKFSTSRALLEYGAYKFQYSLGDYSYRMEGMLKYAKRFTY